CPALDHADSGEGACRQRCPDRLRPTGEKRKDGIGGFGADNRGQLFACGAPDTSEAAERGQQRLAPARTDAGDVVELGSKIAQRARTAVKRDRKSMRLVADAL